MIIGAPGQTNIIYAGSGWIGCKTLASPRMDIIGGYTRFVNGWLTVGRGTETAASPQSPSLHIRDAAVSFEGSGLCLDNANGQATTAAAPLDGLQLVCSGRGFPLRRGSQRHGPRRRGASSSMICNQQTDHRSG
jgi:hypothetical protein